MLLRYKIPSDRVIMKGYVATESVLGILRQASLLVIPSYYEGFGLPAVEAMASGCPVVASNVASLPEICGDAALYVDPYKPHSIAEGMRRMLTDDLFREGFIRRGLRRVQKFNWERSLENHLGVIESLVAHDTVHRPSIRPVSQLQVQA